MLCSPCRLHSFGPQRIQALSELIAVNGVLVDGVYDGLPKLWPVPLVDSRTVVTTQRIECDLLEPGRQDRKPKTAPGALRQRSQYLQARHVLRYVIDRAAARAELGLRPICR